MFQKHFSADGVAEDATRPMDMVGSKIAPRSIPRPGSMAAQPHILIVEDDSEISAYLSRFLRGNGCHVSVARDGRDMDRLLADSRIDLIILDLMLPGEDGLSLCRRLRVNLPIPIVIVSAKDHELDRIIGLEIGADDYLAKPFNPRELLARIRAVLRRSGDTVEGSGAVDTRTLVFNGWQLDTLHRTLLSPSDTQVVLTSAEAELLTVFCQRPRRPLSRYQLLDLTKRRAAGSNERSIDILVARVRRKIEREPGKPETILTVRSGGYMFTPLVTEKS